jgi:hypothetical protein
MARDTPQVAVTHPLKQREFPPFFSRIGRRSTFVKL